MKRSEINQLLREAKYFFSEHSFLLPPWAEYNAQDFLKRKTELQAIREQMLGWDITDFGSSRFFERGLLLFTLRNGRAHPFGKKYAEKIMIVRENQETPLHFHWQKMEDIINRGGGNLVVELFNCQLDDEAKLSDKDVQVEVDGLLQSVPAGKPLVLHPGQSICMTPKLYHRFYAEKGYGSVLTGEVSLTNDDKTDNRFYQEVGRFPEIEEDEAILHYLVSDYASL